MKIYTKTGDHGQTSLIGGQRVSKGDLRLECYGTADELNSFIGLLLSKITEPELADILLNIQNKLFTLGAYLANPDNISASNAKPEQSANNANNINNGIYLTTADVHYLEQCIDNLSKDLPPLRGFVLPSGNERIALCHVCRTITRRLERNIVRLLENNTIAPDKNNKNYENDPNNTPNANNENSENNLNNPINCLQYVNRLSDFFFILSRFVGQIDGKELFLWKK